MKPYLQLLLLLFGLLNLSCDPQQKSQPAVDTVSDLVQVNLCIENNKISADWKNALATRQSQQYLDSLSGVIRELTKEESDWYQLITSRTQRWAQLRDSLKVPFGNLYIHDTTHIFLGYQGSDDGFTYGYQTICFDLTALHGEYGSATDSINTDRIDRLFAHEYTHLLSKEWARQNGLKLDNFRDSILWECMYEGLGMYRSMSAKWFPEKDSLSPAAIEAFENLYPTFSERMSIILSIPELSENHKARLHKNLSRGSMTQKWGALPVAVWIALEAKGNDKNLEKWINKGPDAVVPLALKYLPPEYSAHLKILQD